MIGFELQTWEAAALPTGSQPLLYIKDFHVNKLSTFSGLLKSAKKVSRKMIVLRNEKYLYHIRRPYYYKINKNYATSKK